MVEKSVRLSRCQKIVRKNPLKRDGLVFFFHPSGKLTRYERINMLSPERKDVGSEPRLPLLWPHSLGSYHSSLPMGFWSQKKVFWKNEPKLCPSLLTIVKKRTQNEPKLIPKKPNFWLVIGAFSPSVRLSRRFSRLYFGTKFPRWYLMAIGKALGATKRGLNHVCLS